METLERQRLEQTAEMLKAMGHPMRLLMLEKLKVESWCVCELAETLGLNKSIASKHLSLLHDVGLLSVEKRGTQVIYSLRAPCAVDMARCAYEAVADSHDSVPSERAFLAI
jgi:ArsR family transcriptional regulator